MSQYKVPQNVEAEDKILGPLTLKQLIYAMIGIMWAGFMVILLHALLPIMILAILPVTTLFLLLAFYQRDGQNFEQFLFALVGFFSQSRQRVWRKEEIVETFHIQAKPPEIEQTQRNPVEVRSQLDRLGSLIDSRGYTTPIVGQTESTVADATVVGDDVATPVTSYAPQDIPVPSVKGDGDIYDLKESPLAQNLTDMLNEAADDVREEAMGLMRERHMQPTTPPTSPPQVSTSVTTATAGDILNLATQRDDLTIAQLAATANRHQALREGQTVEVRNNHGSVVTD